jgi:hypothetical protein
MSKYNNYIQEIPRLREEYFKDHVAELHSKSSFQVCTHPNNVDPNQSRVISDVEILLWENPQSWDCYMTFILFGGVLYVSGDLGEAVFCMGRDFKTMQSLSSINVDYMSSKCQASEYGKPYYEWNGTVAVKELKQCFMDHLKDDCDGREPNESEILALTSIQSDMIDTDHGHRSELYKILSIHASDMETLFDDQWYHDYTDFGIDYALRMKLMHLGLMDALKQLNPQV